MLGKLIKHDFKALSRLLIPTILAILGATVIISLTVRFNFSGSMSALADSPWAQLLSVMSAVVTGIMVLAIIAAFVLILFVIYQHFYKSFMTSQGYLTFTLPVTTNSLLWSKLITAVLWLAISAVAGFLCINIFALLAPSENGLINMDVFSFYGELFRSFSHFGTGDIWTVILEILLFAVIGGATTILHIYLALIIGGVVSQKHKLLAGIGFYFVINIAMGIITSATQIFFLNSVVESGGNVISGNTPAQVLSAIVNAIQPYYWTTLATIAVFGVVFFILSHYLLKNKLNLE